MTQWEKMVQDYFEGFGYLTEWAHLRRNAVFLLAWRGKEIQLVFLDMDNSLNSASDEKVRGEFLNLISYLIRQSAWEGIFKGRDVQFKWLARSEPSEEGKKILSLAGVEPLKFGDLGKFHAK